MTPPRIRDAVTPVAKRDSTFIPFCRLPPELRLMIWEEFVYTPRIIHIIMRGEDIFFGFTVKIDGRFREQVCPLLCVSRESRYVAMKASLILFGFRYPLGLDNRTSAPRDFAIRSHDFVALDSDELFYLKLRGETDKIANIIMHTNTNYLTPSGLKWDGLGLSGIYKGLNLTRALRNEHCLKSFYYLIRNARTKIPKKFDLCDIREFAPSQFPLYEEELTDWLRRFRLYEEELTDWLRQFRSLPRNHDGSTENMKSRSALLDRWRNVSLS